MTIRSGDNYDKSISIICKETSEIKLNLMIDTSRSFLFDILFCIFTFIRRCSYNGTLKQKNNKML